MMKTIAAQLFSSKRLKLLGIYLTPDIFALLIPIYQEKEIYTNNIYAITPPLLRPHYLVRGIYI